MHEVACTQTDKPLMLRDARPLQILRAWQLLSLVHVADLIGHECVVVIVPQSGQTLAGGGIMFSTCPTVRLFVRPSVTKLVNTIFWTRMSQFLCNFWGQVNFGVRRS